MVEYWMSSPAARVRVCKEHHNIAVAVAERRIEALDLGVVGPKHQVQLWHDSLDEPRFRDPVNSASRKLIAVEAKEINTSR
jgi:hypothetical protein